MSDLPVEKVSYYEEVEDPRLRHLKQLQSDRLAGDYADLAAIPENHGACHFFFNRLYSTDDTTARDEAFETIFEAARPVLIGGLGRKVRASMEKLIELQHLTTDLDAGVLDALAAAGAPVECSLEEYEAAYQAADAYEDRVRQIELLDFTMALVHDISHRIGVGLMLKGLRAASFVVGDTRMIDFLQEGYDAFVSMPSVEALRGAMWDRELHRLDRIYGRLPEGAGVEGYAGGRRAEGV